MAVREVVPVLTRERPRSRLLDRLGEKLPQLVVAPSFAATLFFVYGFILWTTYLSFTKSRMMPITAWDGTRPYERLWANPVWWTALENLVIYGVLYIGIASCLGLLLAILLDQRIRAEGVLRTIYLYPMAISFIVTGTAWKWILNPGIGIEKLAHDLEWIADRSARLYLRTVAATGWRVLRQSLRGLVRPDA